MKVKYIPVKRCARIKFNESDGAKLRAVLNKTTHPFRIMPNGVGYVAVKDKVEYCVFVEQLKSVMTELQWHSEPVERIN